MQRSMARCVMLRASPYDDAVCVNAAVEINMLDYNVDVRSVNGVLGHTSVCSCFYSSVCLFVSMCVCVCMSARRETKTRLIRNYCDCLIEIYVTPTVNCNAISV